MKGRKTEYSIGRKPLELLRLIKDVDQLELSERLDSLSPKLRAEGVTGTVKVRVHLKERDGRVFRSDWFPFTIEPGARPADGS